MSLVLQIRVKSGALLGIGSRRCAEGLTQFFILIQLFCITCSQFFFSYTSCVQQCRKNNYESFSFGVEKKRHCR